MWIKWTGGSAIRNRVWGEHKFTRRNHHTVFVEDLATAQQMLGDPRSPFSGGEFVVSEIDMLLSVVGKPEYAALLVVEKGIMEVEQLAALKRSDVKKVADLLGESEEVVKAWVGSAKVLLTAEGVEIPGVIEEIDLGG